MTLVQYLFETGPQGATMTHANSESTAASVQGGGTTTFDGAMAASGLFGMRANAPNTSSHAYRRYIFSGGVSVTDWAASFVITLPSAPPSAAIAVARFANTADSTRFTVRLWGDGRLQISDVGDTHFGNLASGLTWGAKYRVSLVVSGGSTTEGQVQAKVYSGTSSWTTQVGTTYTATDWNLGSDTVNRVDIGVAANASSPVTLGIDDLQLDDGRTTEIPCVSVISTPIPTPANVTVETVPPSAPGGQGSVTLSWDRVAQAADGYRVEIAPGHNATTGFTERTTVPQAGTPRITTTLTDEPGEYSYRIYARP